MRSWPLRLSWGSRRHAAPRQHLGTTPDRLEVTPAASSLLRGFFRIFQDVDEDGHGLVSFIILAICR